MRAIPVGQHDVWIGVSRGYGVKQVGAGTYKAPGVTPGDEALFTRADVDCGGDDECEQWVTFVGGVQPELYLVARAERAGRVVRVDSPLVSDNEAISFSTTVAANAFTTSEIGVHAEALFTTNEGALVFDDIVASDVNADGRVSAGELRATKALAPPPPCVKNRFSSCMNENSDTDRSMHELLARRSGLLWRK